MEEVVRLLTMKYINPAQSCGREHHIVDGTGVTIGTKASMVTNG